MYFPDLTPCRYGNGPCSQKSWRAPLLAIGWLEHPHPFTLGDPPAELRSRIKAVIRQNANHLHPIAFFGLHECSLCAAIRSCDSSLPGSHTNLFVPGDGVIFAAPGRVDHYLEAHSYLPPKQFIDAVLACPDVGSLKYKEALRVANAGVMPPI